MMSNQYPYPSPNSLPASSSNKEIDAARVWFFYFPASIPSNLISNAVVALQEQKEQEGPSASSLEMHFVMDKHMHMKKASNNATHYLMPSITVPAKTEPIILKKKEIDTTWRYPFPLQDDDLYFTDDTISFYISW